MNPIETFTFKGCTIEIHHDELAESPRTEYESGTIFACWSRRFNGSDQMIDRLSEEEMHERFPEILAILPLYILSHGADSISTTPFSDRWDSGQIGWVVVTKGLAETIGWIGDGYPKEKLEEFIRSDVETYNQYMNGEVYYFAIKDPSGEEISSVSGFYGMETVLEAAKEECPDLYDGEILESEMEIVPLDAMMTL